MTTPKEKILTEDELKEEQKDTQRFEELNKKADKNEDENKELDDIKKRYGSRADKRINKLVFQRNTATEEKEKLKKENEELKGKVNDFEKAPKSEPKTTVKEKFVKIRNKDGKEEDWHTDESLIAMVNAGDITEAAGTKYQQDRIKAEAVSEAVDVIDGRNQAQLILDARKKDAADVLGRHPEWDPKHPNHNPADEVLVLTQQIYGEGYAANVKGLSLAEKRAKQILRKTDTPIDRTEDLNLETHVPGDRKTDKTKEVTLLPHEEEAAIAQFTRGDVINPKTQNPYTVNEAKVAALEAKKARRR